MDEQTQNNPEDVENVNQDPTGDPAPVQQEKTSEKPYDLEPNIEAALSYLFAPISGVIVFVMEKNNNFVRFHAMQSILFGVLVFALNLVIAPVLVLVTFGLAGIVLPLFWLLFAALWLYLMWKAYNNEEYEIPVLGKIARKQLNK